MSNKNEKYYLETNHRVLEVIMGDGNSKFYPQKKILFTFWLPILDSDYSKPTPCRYSSLKGATNFLRDRQMRINGDKIIKTTTHPFNLVFEKLKQNNHE